MCRPIAYVQGMPEVQYRSVHDQEDLKMFYYRGLKEWNNEKGYLMDTCLTAQDRYKEYLDYFRISYS